MANIDAAEAVWMFCFDYHVGYHCDLYIMSSRLLEAGFRPRISLCSSEDLSEEGLEFYNRLYTWYQQ